MDLYLTVCIYVIATCAVVLSLAATIKVIRDLYTDWRDET